MIYINFGLNNMNEKIKYIIVVLRISEIMYYFLGFIFLYYIVTSETGLLLPNFFILSVLSIVFGVFFEFVIRGLKKRKYWAWVASIIICGVSIPSLLIIPSIIGLITLLNKEVRKEFVLQKEVA